MKKEEKELYIVTDTVSGSEIMYFTAKNDKDAVRNCVLSGLFKMMRFDEVKIERARFMQADTVELDTKAIVEELKYKFENEGEKIKGTVDEVKDKILDKDSSKN